MRRTITDVRDRSSTPRIDVPHVDDTDQMSVVHQHSPASNVEVVIVDIDGMKSEVFQWACSKGWEPEPNRTFGDECALINSEIFEALDTYRIRKLEAYTSDAGKPDDVASEFADVLVRLCHYSAAGRFQLTDRTPMPDVMLPIRPVTFGDQCSVMSLDVARAFEHGWSRDMRSSHLSLLCSRLVEYSEYNGFNLEHEFRRKMDYNYSRPWRHGGKAM